MKKQPQTEPDYPMFSAMRNRWKFFISPRRRKPRSYYDKELGYRAVLRIRIVRAERFRDQGK